jgi:hypothetical protein
MTQTITINAADGYAKALRQERKRERRRARKAAKAQARTARSVEEARAYTSWQRQQQLADLDRHIARMANNQTPPAANNQTAPAPAEPLAKLAGPGPAMAAAPGRWDAAAITTAAGQQGPATVLSRWEPPQMRFVLGRGWVQTRPGRWA